MMHVLRTVFILPTIVATVACTTILDTHSTGTGPAGSGDLSGSPTGDSVTAQGNVIFNGDNINLAVNGSTPAPAVEFSPGGKPHNTDEYTLNFSGVKLTITDKPVMAIDVIDDASRIACGLEIAGGEIRLVGGSGTTIADTYSFNADIHRILMRMDKDTDRCFVRIEQVPSDTDGPPIKPVVNANTTFVNSNFDELDHVRVRWENTSSSDATQYFLGPMEITKHD